MDSNFLNHSASSLILAHDPNLSICLHMHLTQAFAPVASRLLCLHHQAIPRFLQMVLPRSSQTLVPSLVRREVLHLRWTLPLPRLLETETSARTPAPAIYHRLDLHPRMMHRMTSIDDVARCNCPHCIALKRPLLPQRPPSESPTTSDQSAHNSLHSPHLNLHTITLCHTLHH